MANDITSVAEKLKNGIPAQYEIEQKPAENLSPRLTPVIWLDSTSENVDLTFTNPEEYMLVATKKLVPSSMIMTGTNNSIHGQLEEFSSNLYNGPFKGSGRDNVYTISNSKANGKTVASYTYDGGDGELLEFEITTDNNQVAAELSKTTTLIPEDKTIKNTTVQNISDEYAMYQKGEVMWYTPPKLEENPLDKLRIAQTGFFNISSDPVTPSNSRIETIYPSEKYAKQDILDNYEVTAEDYDAYWQHLQAKYNSATNVQVESDLYTQYKEMNSLEPYILRKKVLIYSQEDPTRYSNIKARSANTATAGMGPRTAAPSYEREAHIKARWTDGYEYLRSAPHIKKIIPYEGNNGYYPIGSLVNVIKELEIEIPLSGVRILSSSNYANASTVMGNDMLSTTDKAVTATAKLLGRPCLEDCMNIEINNVSNRFSGVWYSENVTHHITPSSYTCEVDFVQKVVPVTQQVIESHVNTQDQFAKLQGLATESEKTGNYQVPSKIALAAAKWRMDHGKTDRNYLVVQNPDNVRQFRIYEADKDFSSDNIVDMDKLMQTLSIE